MLNVQETTGSATPIRADNGNRGGGGGGGGRSRSNSLSLSSGLEAPPSELTPLLANFGLVDVETLDSQNRSGQCQFTSLVPSLSSGGLTAGMLRNLSVAFIWSRPKRYGGFITMPKPLTRKDHRKVVDLETYCGRMKQSAVDGDHVTLQGISDCLGIRIGVVKKIGEGWIAVSFIKPDCGDEGAPQGKVGGLRAKVRKELKGRTVWIGHVGEEAHFRLIRRIEGGEKRGNGGKRKGGKNGKAYGKEEDGGERKKFKKYTPNKGKGRRQTIKEEVRADKGEKKKVGARRQPAIQPRTQHLTPLPLVPL